MYACTIHDGGALKYMHISLARPTLAQGEATSSERDYMHIIMHMRMPQLQATASYSTWMVTSCTDDKHRDPDGDFPGTK